MKCIFLGATARAAPVPPVNQQPATPVGGGDSVGSNQAFLQQQQQELQAKILSILNGSSAGATPSQPVQGVQAAQSSAWAGGAQAVAAPRGLPASQPQGGGGNPLINFDNPNVQKALDNLIQSGPNLLKSIPASQAQARPGFNSAPGVGPVSRAPPPQQSAQQGYGGYQQQQQTPQGVGAPRMGGYGAQQPGARPMGPRAPQQPMRPRY